MVFFYLRCGFDVVPHLDQPPALLIGEPLVEDRLLEQGVNPVQPHELDDLGIDQIDGRGVRMPVPVVVAQPGGGGRVGGGVEDAADAVQLGLFAPSRDPAIRRDGRKVTAGLDKRWTLEAAERFARQPPPPPLDPLLKEQLRDVGRALPGWWASGRLTASQQKALLRSLDAGQVAFAGLDVVEVAVDADANYCFEGRKVIIFKDLGKDQRVGVVTTDADGEASMKDKKANGKYFAQLTQAPSAKYGDLSICLGDKSNKLKV